MEKITYCGLRCSDCSAYIATINDDDFLRGKTAKEWSEMSGNEIKASDINCSGCRIKDGAVFGLCSICEIRDCAVERSLENCAYCGDFMCRKLEDFSVNIPKGIEYLKEINSKLNK